MKKNSSTERKFVVRTKSWDKLLEALGTSHITYVTSTPKGYVYVSNYDSSRFAEHITR
jgi:hypothetical protein